MDKHGDTFFPHPFYTSEEICEMEIINCRKETSYRGDEYWYADLVTPIGLRKVFHRDNGPSAIINKVIIFGATVRYGTITYHYKGLFHRKDGPAHIIVDHEEEWSDYSKHTIVSEEWFEHNEHHRASGPAITRRNGDKEWFLDNELHREDGPAIEHSNGDKEWYVHGKYFETKDKFKCMRFI